MEAFTIHPAEAYLRNEQNPTSLYVKIEGKRRRLFINRNEMSSALSHRENGKEAIFLRIGRVSRRYTTRPKGRSRQWTRTGN